jgi:hypothetical protein
MPTAIHSLLRLARTKSQPRLAVYALFVSGILGIKPLAFADGGSAANPDLQVGGYSVFGTNTTGATSVTSGWGNVYIDGSLQIRSNLYVNTRIISTNKIEAAHIETDRISIKQREQIIDQGGTIQPLGSYIRIRGNTGPVTLGNPQIANGDPGQLITLQGIATSVRVTLVSGAGLRTNLEKPFTLGAFDTIQFIYDESTSTWVEINRSNNRWE